MQQIDAVPNPLAVPIHPSALTLCRKCFRELGQVTPKNPVMFSEVGPMHGRCWEADQEGTN